MRKNKARDLRRGILPSTARKGARDNKRNVRHCVRNAERELIHEIEINGWDDSSSDPNVDYMHRTREAVRDRRDADKIAPIMRWAEDLVKKHPNAAPDELFAKARAVVGHSYMGDHAMTHIENVEGFEAEYRFGFDWTPEARAERAKIRAEETEDDIFDLINRWQDLWLKGRAKAVHAEMSGMSSRRPVEGWVRKIRIEHHFYGFEEVGGVRRAKYNEREVEYWTNAIQGYDEIAERARECVLYGGGPKPYGMR